MLDASNIHPAIRGQTEVESIDRVIRVLAERQHGTVARRQLLTLGLGHRAIDHRIATGRLIVVHRGVYALGRARLTRRGIWMAVVLACGPDAVLSHRDAAALHGFRPDNRRKIDVTVPRWRKGPKVVDVHTARIEDDERTVIDGIPVTTAFRTLLDLATTLNQRELQQALNETERLHITEPLSLTSLLERHARRPGTRRLRELRPEPRITKSQLERDFLAYLQAHDLPLPQTNVVVGAYTVDCLWRKHGLIAEVDGYEFHDTRRTFDEDKERDQDLAAAGFLPIRVTAPHLKTARLARRLRTLLTR